ncbi:MAG: OprD family outer membrane porin, partial [Candidatus Accumulibacter sp.]|nr:OprD family outer membrane porin [Accumulibacter sp.]
MRPRAASRRAAAAGAALLLMALPAARAADAAASLRETKITGALMYFQRDRERYDIVAGRYRDNLKHSTLQTQIDISTPYFLGGAAGIELGVFGTKDLANPAGAPDHEISFFPWRNPWSPDWSKRDAKSGFSLYRAHLKLRHETEGGARLWGKLGYFQPEGPGVLGVNWSLMPGTYSGLEAGIARGAWSAAGALVTRYKAPWYRQTYAFLDDEKRDRKRIWSLGLRYAQAGVTAEAAYGEAPGYLRSAHLKLAWEGGGRALRYQLYLMADRDDSGSPNDHFDGLALQHYLAYTQTAAPWTVKAEFTHTRAPFDGPQHRGYFAYRLTGWYGGNKGAYEPWWDNRSDWNHHRESAVFVSVSRALDDLGLPGVAVGASAVRGWGGKAWGVSETLKEKSWSIDLSWRLTSGPLKNARISLHVTRYDNQTRQPSWTGFKNLFQDDRDVKFLIVIP